MWHVIVGEAFSQDVTFEVCCFLLLFYCCFYCGFYYCFIAVLLLFCFIAVFLLLVKHSVETSLSMELCSLSLFSPIFLPSQ